MCRAFACAFVYAGVLCLVSCAPQEPDMSALKKAVDDFNSATKDGMLSGNMEKVIGYYQDDAMEMAPNMAMGQGKDAIKAMQQQMMSSGMKMTAVSFSTTELQAAGKIGYEIGTYDMTIAVPQMGEVKDKGKYIALWHQQPDGSWKVRAETWNSDMPLPSMEPKKEEMQKEGGTKKN